MDKNDFYNKIQITQEEKAKADYFLNVRGIEEHIIVFDYLSKFKIEAVTYSEVATALRYDKRIRRVIFKYIGFLEEKMRAYIANEYSDKVESLKLIDELKDNVKSMSLYKALSKLLFGRLVEQVKSLSKKEKEIIFSNENVSNQNLEALCSLRNEISHNKFILHQEFGSCSASKKNSKSLCSNIKNIYYHLPINVRENFKKEINECSLYRESDISYQTQWNLLKNIVINI